MTSSYVLLIQTVDRDHEFHPNTVETSFCLATNAFRHLRESYERNSLTSTFDSE